MNEVRSYEVEARDRRRRKAVRAAMPDVTARVAKLREAGVVEAGDAEYLVREMQQHVIDGEGKA